MVFCANDAMALGGPDAARRVSFAGAGDGGFGHADLHTLDSNLGGAPHQVKAGGCNTAT